MSRLTCCRSGENRVFYILTKRQSRNIKFIAGRLLVSKMRHCLRFEYFSRRHRDGFLRFILMNFIFFVITTLAIMEYHLI